MELVFEGLRLFPEHGQMGLPGGGLGRGIAERNEAGAACAIVVEADGSGDAAEAQQFADASVVRGVLRAEEESEARPHHDVECNPYQRHGGFFRCGDGDVSDVRDACGGYSDIVHGQSAEVFATAADADLEDECVADFRQAFRDGRRNQFPELVRIQCQCFSGHFGPALSPGFLQFNVARRFADFSEEYQVVPE